MTARQLRVSRHRLALAWDLTAATTPIRLLGVLLDAAVQGAGRKKPRRGEAEVRPLGRCAALRSACIHTL
jgi:hypothetical protein